MASSLLLPLLVLTHLISSFTSTVAISTYDVTDFGAKPDGETDSAEPFLQAWNAACNSSSQSTVHVPGGSFLIGQVTFAGPCKSSKITVQINGTLVAPSNYDGVGKKTNWILFDHVEGVSVIGGTIDGQGAPLWSCKASGKNCPDGVTSLRFHYSKNILISGLTSINSKLYHIVIDTCQAVTVQGVNITAPGNSPNTDGIHVEMSAGVTITDTSMETGDDCVSIGQGTTDLWIERVSCGPGHGISIGSLGKEMQEKGVQNVTVKAAMFTGSQNGVRIKSWARPSDSYVKDVTFENVTMQNVQNPIIIDQNYCPHDEGCPGQSSGVKISGVAYRDIRGSSATQVAVSFDCSPSNPCTGIRLQDIKLTYGNDTAESSCNHVADVSSSGVVEPPSCL